MDVVTEVSDAERRDFLDTTPQANVFQSAEMAHVYERTEGYRPIVVAAESRGEIRALMASAIVWYGPRLIPTLTARAVVTGGPIGDPDGVALVLGAHNGLVRNSVLLTQIRNLAAPSQRRAFEAEGYQWEDHVNFLMDLEKGEEAILAGMSKARRKGIAEAEREGLEIRELTPGDLPAAYSLLQKTYSRAGIPLAHQSLFDAALGILGPSDHLLAMGAALDGRLHAVRFLLRWGATLYDWYAGSDLNPPIHADEWLVWQCLRRGIQAGCTTFDFGGAGNPDEPYGPREFKRRFGGRVVNPGRFEKVYWPLTTRAAKTSYAIWRRIAEGS